MLLQRCLGDITVVGALATQVAFKNCAPFTKSITKIGKTTIGDAENLDLVMPIYSLIEYSSIYSETTGTLWCYSKDEATNFNADIANDNNFESFEYEDKLAAPNDANRILKNAVIAAPLKYLSNFWRSLEMSLTNCKVVLKLTWSKHDYKLQTQHYIFL